jgi:hypothetical protein
MTNHPISIRWNNCLTNDPCPLCGERCDPCEGPELFLGGSYELVCWQCGRQFSPELVATLEIIRKIPDVIETLKKNADRIKDGRDGSVRLVLRKDEPQP